MKIDRKKGKPPETPLLGVSLSYVGSLGWDFLVPTLLFWYPSLHYFFVLSVPKEFWDGATLNTMNSTHPFYPIFINTHIWNIYFSSFCFRGVPKVLWKWVKLFFSIGASATKVGQSQEFSCMGCLKIFLVRAKKLTHYGHTCNACMYTV